jgi:hypothetical protein
MFAIYHQIALTRSKRRKLLTLLVNAIAKRRGAHPYFVQVQIEETRADRYLGGQLTQNHIWIRGDIRAGRAPEVRSSMMLNIMRDIKDITGLIEDNIWVYVNNLLPTDMVEYGHVLPSPGEEQQWFNNLPPRLREYLESLGVKKETFTL